MSFTTTTKADPAPAEPVSRRSVLSGVAALVPAAALAAVAAPAAGAVPPSPTLADLIDAHRAAYDRLQRAAVARSNLDDAFDEELRRNMVLVPLTVMPNGRYPAGRLQLELFGAEEVRGRIRVEHELLRSVHCSESWKAAFPELAATAEREIAASEARALQALADGEAELADRQRALGIAAAEEAEDAAAAAEFRARVALAIHAPRSAKEARAKLAYINEAPFADDYSVESDLVQALIEHLSVVRA